MFVQHENIIGERLLLRPITMADTDYIVQWRNTSEVRKNFIFQETFTPEIHMQWMNTKVASGEVVQYIIVVKDTGEAIGSVYYRDVDMNNESAEFGIFIGAENARGCGYGTEATKLFLDYGLKKMKLHRISLRVLDNNESAIHVYKRAGFAKEGVFKDMVKLNGVFRDVVFMAVVAE